MRELDYKAVEASGDQQAMNKLVQQYEPFILKCASSATRHYISKSDDEWSIAMMAFMQAVRKYRMDKGGFRHFAELTIRRRLIDYFKAQAKYSPEISVNPAIFNTESDDEEQDHAVRAAVAEQVSRDDEGTLKLEIESVNQVFNGYGFSFFDLTDCSPRAGKTRSACAKASAYLLSNPLLIVEMRRSKQLPLKIITENVKIPRKILERHRKYIIAAVEILSGEYPYLAEYMRYIREEMGK